MQRGAVEGGGDTMHEGGRRRHLSARFCHSPLEFGRLPAVPCHSGWLETAGYHGGLDGTRWYEVVQHWELLFA